MSTGTSKMTLKKFWLVPLLYLTAVCAHAQQVLWIDVRTPEEYRQGHRPAAINIPYDQIGARIADLDLASDAPIMLYCQSGRRAESARATLTSLGFTRVVNVGGIAQALQAEP